MGRRAKKAPVVTKKRPKLSKRFKCPFCANDDVVEAKMDFKLSVGSLTCRLCGASYQMPIHSLHEPIDVFSEWLDDCEQAAAANNANQQQQQQTSSNTGTAGATRYDDEDDEDDEDDIPESSGLGGNNRRVPASASASSRPKSSNKDNRHAKSIDLGDEDSDDD